MSRSRIAVFITALVMVGGCATDGAGPAGAGGDLTPQAPATKAPKTAIQKLAGTQLGGAEASETQAALRAKAPAVTAFADEAATIRAALDRGAIFDPAGLDAAFSKLEAELTADETRLVAHGLEEAARSVRETRETIVARRGDVMALARTAAGKSGRSDQSALRRDLREALDGVVQVRPAPRRGGAVRVPAWQGATRSAEAQAPEAIEVHRAAIYQPNNLPPAVDTCAPGDADPLCVVAGAGPVDPSLEAMVDALGRSPYRIYQYVRDEVDLAAHERIWKGPAATPQTGLGGFDEQAELMSTLLRLAGVPTTYATGWLYVPMETLRNWLGQETLDAAQGRIAYFREYRNRFDSSGTTGYFVKMTWVEAWVPYDNRMGEGAGYRWAPLFPQYAPRHELPGQPGITDERPFDEADFLTAVRRETSDEYYRTELADYLNANNAGFGESAVAFVSEPGTEDIALLPSTLPLETVDAEGVIRADALPASIRLGAHIDLYSPGGALLVATRMDMSEHALHRFTIGWLPATVADQAVIDANGGLALTPVGAVNLKPVVRVEGESLAQGAGQPYGNSVELRGYFDIDNATASSRSKSITVGDLFNVGFDGGQFSEAFLREREAALVALSHELIGVDPADHREDISGELLYLAGVKYFLDVARTGDRLGGYYHYKRQTFYQHLTTSSNAQVYCLANRPYYIVPKGAVLDAWALFGNFRPLDADDTDFGAINRNFAWAASALEHMLWEHYLDVDSVSTTKLMQMATVMGMPIHDFAPNTDPNVIRAALNLTAQMENWIVADNSSGSRMQAHESVITLNDWSGVGWFKDDGAGGFAMMIGGGLNAEQTPAPVGGVVDAIDEPSAELGDQLAGLDPGMTGRASHGGAGTEDPPSWFDSVWDWFSGDDDNNVEDPVNLLSGNFYNRSPTRPPTG